MEERRLVAMTFWRTDDRAAAYMEIVEEFPCGPQPSSLLAGRSQTSRSAPTSRGRGEGVRGRAVSSGGGGGGAGIDNDDNDEDEEGPWAAVGEVSAEQLGTATMFPRPPHPHDLAAPHRELLRDFLTRCSCLPLEAWRRRPRCSTS